MTLWDGATIFVLANVKTKNVQPAVERVFRALSDRTRLRILNLLGGGELCVCDLVATLGVPQPTASRHLSYLRRAGLVRVRKEGLWAYYRLVPAQAAWHAEVLECLHRCGQTLPWLVKDKKKLYDSLSSTCDD